jgi:hypothetical protein
MSQLRGAKLIIGGDESSGIHDTSVTSREGNLMNNRPMRPIKRSSERVMLAMSICRISMRLDWRGIEFPQRLDDARASRVDRAEFWVHFLPFRFVSQRQVASDPGHSLTQFSWLVRVPLRSPLGRTEHSREPVCAETVRALSPSFARSRVELSARNANSKTFHATYLDRRQL